MNTLLDITEGQEIKQEKLLYLPQCPGKQYFQATRRTFNKAASRGSIQGEKFEPIRRAVADDILQILQHKPHVRITASPFISTQTANVNGQTHVFIANFKGLKGRKNASQIPESGVTLTLSTGPDTRIRYLPFLGEIQDIQGDWKEGVMTCVLPDIGKGAVVWFE